MMFASWKAQIAGVAARSCVGLFAIVWDKCVDESDKGKLITLPARPASEECRDKDLNKRKPRSGNEKVLPPGMATPYRPGLLAHGKRLAGRCDALVNHLNVQRIYQDIDATARMAGATGDGGVERLALDAHDLVVRQWFREQAEELGLAYTIDDMGCQRATLAGQTPHAAPIGIGSHFDTTPCGGRFDGVLGMMCGLEVLRSYRGAGITPLRPISVINWTGEEGSR